MRTSRLPGFYKLSLNERRRIAAEALGVDASALEEALAAGGLEPAMAEKTVENVVGTYALPFALGLNVRVNGRDALVPMVVEEPSVVAAASNASKMIRAGGGFEAESDAPIMISQVQLDDVPSPAVASDAILAHETEILEIANASVPGLVRRGGGARSIEVRDLGDGMMVVHVLVDCRDAMGANLVNTVAEKVAHRLAELSGGHVGLRILSNLCDRRRVRVRARIPVDALHVSGRAGEVVRDAIVRASRFAEKDPYRAATHNKGIMNGVDAVVIATGNDWRAVEAGAHAFASRNGRYEPLCTWRRGDDGALVGYMEIPLALGIVGGPTRVHTGAQLGLKVAAPSCAGDLAMLAACVGMASNLAALRALATDGIQRGHMALHARSVAIAAGARDDLVEQVAAEIHQAGDVTLDAARRVLARLTGQAAVAAPATATAPAE
ncbi:MAG: hydroxymethylglutaryl-CoA reductase, degradative [Myxococcota bacterium]